MINFRRSSRALNRLFSKCDGFTLFSARFAQMISLSSLQMYNHWTFCGVLRAYFVNIFTLKLQNVYIPPFNFGFYARRETMVLAEDVNISISIHNLCPHHWRWVDAPGCNTQIHLVIVFSCVSSISG